MMNIEQLADEIRAEHRAKFKRNRWDATSKYLGLRSNRSFNQVKDAEYVYVRGRKIRALSEKEIADFREGVQRRIDAGVPRPIRLPVTR